ncbi:MAG: MarR family transcriptional regulator [Treponema sp.]|nr:MarR family transcriptional regulator [Treponema sp.]
MSDKFDCLKLENQLCFPLYAASREVLRRYTPLLKPLDLTYTQYIVLMVLWEQQEISVCELGKKLFLDTGTLSPLLKSMEKKDLLTRTRAKSDERIVNVAITKEGMALREKAADIPPAMGSCLSLSQEEAAELYRLLYKLLNV